MAYLNILIVEETGILILWSAFQIWRSDGGQLFKKLQLLAQGFMDEVADLCNSRYSEILEEPYGRELTSLQSWPVHPPICNMGHGGVVENGAKRAGGGGGGGAICGGNAARTDCDSQDTVLGAADAACLLPWPADASAINTGGPWSVISHS